MTSKELAEQLGLSQAAVSLALNNKPGVSEKTRARVKEAALKAGMDISNMSGSHNGGDIRLIYYRKHGAVLQDTSFFTSLAEGIDERCRTEGYRVSSVNIYDQTDLRQRLNEYAGSDTAGVILLGTEMQEDDFQAAAEADIPLVLLDNHFQSDRIDSIQINNMDGAYTAAEYLIHKKRKHPGLLSSSYSIYNFMQREQGFQEALRHNGMSVSSTIVHQLTPSINGAYQDMKEILNHNEDLAAAYFAENDLIAIGAMRALKEKGIRIPEDVAMIGFDDTPMSEVTDPGLTTVSVPKEYMGAMAADRLLTRIRTRVSYPVNIEIEPHLIIRHSV